MSFTFFFPQSEQSLYFRLPWPTDNMVHAFTARWQQGRVLHFESFDMVVEIIRFALRIKTKARSACPICHWDKPRYAKMFFPYLSLLYKTYGLPYKSIGTNVSSIGTGSILFHYLIVSRIVFDNITSHLIWSSYKIVIFIVDMTYGGLARDFSGNHTLKIPCIPIPYYIGTRQVIKFL